MNAVEIEEAVSELAAAPLTPAEFPYAFLAAFGNKETTIKRLRSGSSNASDVPGGVLQRNNIHLAVCAPGAVGATLTALRESPKRASAKAKLCWRRMASSCEAEEIASGDMIVCPYPECREALRLLSPAGRHFDGQADRAQPDRHQSDRAAQRALCRTAEGQSGLGNGRPAS